MLAPRLYIETGVRAGRCNGNSAVGSVVDVIVSNGERVDAIDTMNVFEKGKRQALESLSSVGDDLFHVHRVLEASRGGSATFPVS